MAMRQRDLAAQRLARRLITSTHDHTSQGPVNEISRRSSDRLGGFVGVETEASMHQGPADRRLRPVESRTGAEFIAAVVRECISDMDSGAATRLSLKTVAREDMLDTLSDAIRARGARIEGSLDIGNGYKMVYIGYNSGVRHLSEVDYRAEAIGSIEKTVRGRSESAVQRTLDIIGNADHIRYELVDNSATMVKPEHYQDIATLLRAFEYDYETAIRNVTAPHNTVALALTEVPNRERVVGIAMTERSQPVFLGSGQVLRTTELTDFVVGEDARGQRISDVLGAMLMGDILSSTRQRSTGMEVIFAEARTSNSMIMTLSALGGVNVGILPNHITVGYEGAAVMQSFALMQFSRQNAENSRLMAELRA